MPKKKQSVTLPNPDAPITSANVSDEVSNGPKGDGENSAPEHDQAAADALAAQELANKAEKEESANDTASAAGTADGDAQAKPNELVSTTRSQTKKARPKSTRSIFDKDARKDQKNKDTTNHVSTPDGSKGDVVAIRSFKVAGKHYKSGDKVTDGDALRMLEGNTELTIKL